jgi:hypothetical protein
MGFIPWLALEKKSCATGTVEGHKLRFFWIPPCLQHVLSVGIHLPRDKSLGFGSDLPLGEGETIA